MIEVNEYVRLARNQGINKIIDKEDDRYILESEIADSYGDITWFLYECELKEEIVKHSKQLIDLIEVGDIVNGCIVVGFGYECVNGNKEKSILVEGKYTKVNYALLNWDIETILTHEQFEQNSYKVGGEYEIS